MKVSNIKRDKSLVNEELIAMARNGCLESKELLFRNNIPLLMKYVRRWKNNGSNVEESELVSIGFMGMMRAFKDYDEKKNTKFTTLLGMTIWQEFIRENQYKNRKIRSMYPVYSIDEFLGEDSELVNLHETLGSNDLSISTKVELKLFKQNIEEFIHSNFSEREKFIFNEHVENKKVFEEIGNTLGVTKQAVQQTYKKSMEKLLNCDLMFA